MKVGEDQWKVEDIRGLGRDVVDRWIHKRETDAQSRATLQNGLAAVIWWYFGV